MNALPINPTERDRERFRDLTKAQGFYLEYDRFGNGEYKHQRTMDLFAVWWSVERERQLLQNLNQSQGCKISELAQKLEKAQMEIEALSTENGFVHQQLEAERKRLDWALEKAATFYEWQGKHYLSYDVPENDGFNVIESTDPLATIDELIAGEKK